MQDKSDNRAFESSINLFSLFHKVDRSNCGDRWFLQATNTVNEIRLHWQMEAARSIPQAGKDSFR